MYVFPAGNQVIEGMRGVGLLRGALLEFMHCWLLAGRCWGCQGHSRSARESSYFPTRSFLPVAWFLSDWHFQFSRFKGALGLLVWSTSFLSGVLLSVMINSDGRVAYVRG